ncbi:MAG: DNA-processing protein DprA [Spirochaetales bacterium]|nr:DNA-processing protein DprA [Spirochaetales bacterium]
MNSRPLLFLALARVTFLTPKERLLMAELLEGIEDFLRLGKRELEISINRRMRIVRFDPAEYVRRAETDELYLTKRNILCTFYGDGKYPALLREIYDPPLVLFQRGELPPDTLQHVAVVGTRRPTGDALKAAFFLGLELAQSGAVVVSGLARGIDRAAHSGCVEGLGRAVAVLGNGIDGVYPVGSRKLAGAILESGGAIVSEYPPGTPPLKHHFPARNRIVSGLSRAVIVVEAPDRSGALITSDYALEQGRELFVHEVGLRPGSGGGGIKLADEGAVRIRRAHETLACRASREAADDDAGFETGESTGDGWLPRCGSLGLSELMELELRNKVFLLDGEVYWRE